MATRRRNGLLSSCEPCRQSKLRCDHLIPVCGRCIETQKSHKCFYHPAPLTRPKKTEGSASAQSGNGKRGQAVLKEKAKRTTNLLQLYRVSVLEAPSPAREHEEDCSASTNRSRHGRVPVSITGYLGASSCLAAFEEPDQSYFSDANSCMEPDVPSVLPDQIRAGARILGLLEDLPLYDVLLNYRYSTCRPWVFGQRLSTEIIGSLYALREEIFHSTNQTKSLKKRLFTFSRRLFRNISEPIKTDRITMPSQYFSSIAMRWETIGLMFAWVALSMTIIPDNHEKLRIDNDGRMVVAKYELRDLAVEVVETCLSFCDDAGTMSDPLTWLLLQHTILLSDIYGETDFKPWRKLGDLSNIIFALGLHQPENRDVSSIPFFLSELRKRIMVAAYSLDKQLATLLGRPPRIAWQYCSIQYPLDLSYDELFAASLSKEQEKQILSGLGPDGWNIKGRITSGSRGRFHLMISKIREKVLAVSLSPHSDDGAQKLLETWIEHEQMCSSLPPALTIQKFLFEENILIDIDTNMESLANLQLEFLNNDLMINRQLVKQAGSNGNRAALVKVAREMLSKLLIVISHATSERGYSNSIWNLRYLGLPCAGVLALELLQPSKTYALDEEPFPRSEILENLRTFASHLEKSLVIKDRKHLITRRGLSAIRNVLNRALSPVEGPSTLLHAHPVDQGVTMEAKTSFLQPAPFDSHDVNFMMVELDSIDWIQESILLNCT
ncbi:hypothetical protein BGW36DRAFT_357489 [Talaromyces proteolyticus]|uniref:Zn(2)-C6 fungal-type domain-containing protein n=1 Tax=Talaromyces proteolyticus TaxID=1131652 RepID=A0AAD4KWN1_9EURO|nr:uncharacterized protein BGW36DRAFT_357489 [Talaromyces proteolyticus]KAH8700848.1 hypothetical protein BGW36DRAFT_357489 [Talaromyces proteolyticus]